MKIEILHKFVIYSKMFKDILPFSFRLDILNTLPGNVQNISQISMGWI